MLAKHTKLLAVRLPEAEKRRIKALAASQGLTLQEAVHEALEAWTAKLQREGTPLRVPPATAGASADSQKPRRQDPRLRNAPKTGPEPQRQPRLPDSRTAELQTPKATRTRGSEGLRPWIGQNVRRWKAFPEIPVAPGLSAGLACRRLPVRRLAEGQRLGEITAALGLTQGQLRPAFRG